MNDSVIRGNKRLMLYYQRVSRALDNGHKAQAMADLSELAFIARRLWEDLSRDDSFPSGKE
jgi:hypothetical protein